MGDLASSEETSIFPTSTPSTPTSIPTSAPTFYFHFETHHGHRADETGPRIFCSRHYFGFSYKKIIAWN
jgi:hypothetical protein